MVLSKTCAFEGRTLQDAIVSTCKRRKTEIRSDAVMFGDDFALRTEKKNQWSAFLGKGAIEAAPEDFSSLLKDIRMFLSPVAEACQRKRDFEAGWAAGGPWT